MKPMYRCVVIVALAALAPLLAGATQAAQDTSATACAALRSPENAVKFSQILDAPTTILSAAVLPAERDLPEFCRVEGQIAPTVGFELRMPTKTWNSKFMMKGCGGPCGTFGSESAEQPLVKNYAVVTTDMGHRGQGWMFAYDNPQGQIDFGFRSTHVTAVAAKVVIEAYYGKPASRNYYMGCSTGGRQGMVEAQRFPHDFEGIIAGAPPWHQTGDRAFFLLWGARANIGKDGKPIMDAGKLPMIHNAVLEACDELDGLKDGILQNPLQCKWDPSEIQCEAERRNKDCLTAEEVAVVRKIYSGATTSSGEQLYWGMPRGSEYNWSPVFVNADGKPGTYFGDLGPIGNSSMAYMAFYYPPGPRYSNMEFDFDRDPQRLWLTEYIFNAQNPDLRRFKSSGGKLILYHGWDDNQIPAAASVDYYETVTRTMGGAEPTREFFRLFMLPNGDHCTGGRGGGEADWIEALENWVEKGQAPDQITAYSTLKNPDVRHYLPRPRFPLDPSEYERSRPVYAYPDLARYTGSGDSRQASSWEKAPRQDSAVRRPGPH